MIPAAELKHAIRTGAYAFGLTREEAHSLVADVDSNNDSFVDFPEFTALVFLNNLIKLIFWLDGASKTHAAQDGDGLCRSLSVASEPANGTNPLLAGIQLLSAARFLG